MDVSIAPAATDRPAGRSRTDLALSRLAEADSTPLSAHVELYDEVHRLLQDALAGLDEGERSARG